MALTFFWRCETNMLDSILDYGVGDQAGNPSGSPSFSPTAARVGVNGILCTGNNDNYTFDSVANDYVLPTEGAAGCSFQFSTALANNGRVFYCRGADSQNEISVMFQTSNNLSFRYRTAGGSVLQLITPGGLLQLNQWYAFVCRWNVTANYRRIELYDAAGVLIDSNQSNDVFTAATEIGSHAWGRVDTSTIQCFVDNCFLSQQSDEPIQDNFLIENFGEYGGVTGNTGGLAATEPRDAFASSGTLIRTIGDAPILEQRDAGSFAGTLIPKFVSGSAAVTEGRDTAAFTSKLEEEVGNTIVMRDSNTGIGVSPETTWASGGPVTGDGINLPRSIGLPPGPDNFANQTTERQCRLIQAIVNTAAGVDILPGWFSYVDVLAGQWVWALNRTVIAPDTDNPIGDPSLP